MLDQVSIADKARHEFQRGTDEPISRSVYGKFVEAAENFSFVEKALRFGSEDVDPTAHAFESRFAMAIATSKISLHAKLNCPD